MLSYIIVQSLIVGIYFSGFEENVKAICSDASYIWTGAHMT